MFYTVSLAVFAGLSKLTADKINSLPESSKPNTMVARVGLIGPSFFPHDATVAFGIVFRSRKKNNNHNDIMTNNTNEVCMICVCVCACVIPARCTATGTILCKSVGRTGGAPRHSYNMIMSRLNSRRDLRNSIQSRCAYR